jgi:TolA-binding protein
MLEDLTLTSQEYNDILEVQTFVRNGLKNGSKADTSAMNEFFRGEFFLKQHKISEAQRTFLHVPELQQSDVLAPYALIRTAQFSKMLGKTGEVENLLTRVVENYPDSEIIDQALFKLGRFYQESNQTAEAIRWYEKILTEHPSSMLEQKARSLIRQLQQQTS